MKSREVRESKEGRFNKKERISHEKRQIGQRWWRAKGTVKPSLPPWEEVQRQRMLRDAERLLKDERGRLACVKDVKELATKHKRRIIIIERCLFELNRPDMDRARELLEIVSPISVSERIDGSRGIRWIPRDSEGDE